jgi:hypothetical protein
MTLTLNIPDPLQQQRLGWNDVIWVKQQPFDSRLRATLSCS